MTAAAMMWAGGGLGAASSIQSGFAGARNAQNAAAEAKEQARVADMNARMARQQGAEVESRLRRSAERQIARQRAGMADAGIDTTTGTPLDLLEQSDIEKELDALTTRYNTELQARNQTLMAGRLRTRADAFSGQVIPSIASGFVGAGSQLATIPYFTRQPSQPTGSVTAGGLQQPVQFGGGWRGRRIFASAPPTMGTP